MKKIFLFTAVSTALSISASAQNRYLDEVFTTVNTTTVPYAQNYYFLPDPSNPTVNPIPIDIYQPVGDTETERPLVIYVHTGNFLPKYFNSGVTGNNKDKSVVEFCNQFAKRGFVAAAPNYRTGWNPLEQDQLLRITGLLNAVYRANIDVQSAVRFFKKDRATDNLYKIDTNRIIIMGQGSGGYVAFANATLDKQSETALPKFQNLQGQSVVNPALVGDINGVGGAVNVENNIEYSRRIHFAVNLGGALGDISWLEAGDVPMVSFQHVRDQFAPYDSGTVIVPVNPPLPVVFVHGSRTAIAKANALGNQTFKTKNFNDPYSARAYSLNPKSTHEGLFAISKPAFANGREDGAPWEWWVEAEVIAEAGAVGLNGANLYASAMQGNPDMSEAKAKTYIDTIMNYTVPRIVVGLDLPGADIVGITAVQKLQSNVEVYPNPSTDVINVSLKGTNNISRIDMIDINGRVVKSLSGLNSTLVSINRDNLPAGNYFLNISSNGVTVTEKVVLK
jgi:hypothetical protein